MSKEKHHNPFPFHRLGSVRVLIIRPDGRINYPIEIRKCVFFAIGCSFGFPAAVSLARMLSGRVNGALKITCRLWQTIRISFFYEACWACLGFSILRSGKRFARMISACRQGAGGSNLALPVGHRVLERLRVRASNQNTLVSRQVLAKKRRRSSHRMVRSTLSVNFFDSKNDPPAESKVSAELRLIMTP